MISKVVRELREKKGIPSRNLAERVGKNHSWISQIETGKIKHPHLPTLKRLLKLLDCTEEQIEKIILNEFPDVEKFSKHNSKNCTDYRLEKRVLLTKRENVDYSHTEIKSFKATVMTEKAYKDKCQKDSHQLFCELKQLPSLTLEFLLDLLVEDL